MSAQAIYEAISISTSFVTGIDGLAMWAAPDFFWNPTYGSFPILFLRDSALGPKTAFDAATIYAFARGGAVGFGLLVVHLALIAMGERHNKAFLRFKVYVNMAQAIAFGLPVLVPSVWDPNDSFLPSCWAVFGLKVLASIYLVWGMKMFPEGPKAQNTTLAWTLGLSTMVFLAPLVVLFMMFPRETAPSGRFPLYAAESGNVMRGEYFDHLAVFSIFLEGISLMPPLLAAWDMVRLGLEPRWVYLIVPALYCIPTARGLYSDPTGYVDKSVYQTLFYASAGFAAFTAVMIYAAQSSQKSVASTKKKN